MKRSPLFVLIVAGLAACGRPEPIPTGTVCPPGGTELTYENFAAPFMEAYCTRCHSSELHGEDRHGAPLYHDFDTEIGILEVGGHVDREAGAGPNGINRLMPYDGDQPTDAERYQLSEWIACALDALAQPDAGVVTADAGPADAAPPDGS
jgi:hypothetical protein